MAYYLYKKIRDKRRRSAEEHLLNTFPLQSDRNEAPIPSKVSTADPLHEDPKQPNSDTTGQEEKRAMRKYRWRLIVGLYLPATVQALNTTMIAGALPFIASDFSKSTILFPGTDAFVISAGR